MKIKCDYCDSMIDETEKSCPHCGAPLSGVNRTAGSSPQTIEQLKDWYIARNLPPEEVTRFFIGKDVREPKAFGIYKNSSGDCVVYKNKADGTRAIRYQGSDEAYAVNELYQRLRSQIEDQKRMNNSRPRTSYPTGTNKPGGCLKSLLTSKIFIIAFVIVLLAIIALIFADGIPNGYYSYRGTDYYRQGDDWYYFDDSYNSWKYADSSSSIYSDINSDNYSNYDTYSYFGNNSFENSYWYDDDSSSSSSSSSSWFDSDDDSDWDSDWSWDSSDSWDSDWGGSDWDSDW